MTKYLVEVVSQFRIRYVVEARELEDALDEVVNKTDVYDPEWREFSQCHIGENIVSSRKINDEEYFELFDQDNEYISNITDEHKLAFVNRVKYTDSEIVPDEREWAYDGLGNKVYKGTMRAYNK